MKPPNTACRRTGISGSAIIATLKILCLVACVGCVPTPIPASNANRSTALVQERGLSMEEKTKKVIVWQALVCPSCKAFVDSLPPETWEAISDGDTIKCNHCQVVFRVRFQILAGDEAVEHGVQSDGAYCTCQHVERPLVDKAGICFSCHQPRR